MALALAFFQAREMGRLWLIQCVVTNVEQAKEQATAELKKPSCESGLAGPSLTQAISLSDRKQGVRLLLQYV